MAWQIRLSVFLSVVCLSVVCDVRAPYLGGLTFRGYFAPSGNSPTKNHEDRPRDHPNGGVK